MSTLERTASRRSTPARNARRRTVARMLTSLATSADPLVARKLGMRNSSSIPTRLPRRLHRHPAMLSATIGGVNWLRRLVTTPGRRLLVAVALAVAATVAWLILAGEAPAIL